MEKMVNLTDMTEDERKAARLRYILERAANSMKLDAPDILLFNEFKMIQDRMQAWMRLHGQDINGEFDEEANDRATGGGGTEATH